jgi:hypothetical protein
MPLIDRRLYMTAWTSEGTEVFFDLEHSERALRKPLTASSVLMSFIKPTVKSQSKNNHRVIQHDIGLI